MAAAKIDLRSAIRSALRDAGLDVIDEVLVERRRQDEKWGEQNHPDGTSPMTGWTPDDLPACTVADLAKTATGHAALHGRVTWRDILFEEVAEAFAEEDPAALRAELIQVAAVAVQWVQAIDRRRQSAGAPS